MTKSEIQIVILVALRQYRGDNLERAKMAFNGYTKKEMNEQYGQSGVTCQELLDKYQSHVDEVEEAIKWVKNQ